MASRKRGAQPGNQNALKHGFYSRQFRELEDVDLSNLSEGLTDEIALMRVLIRRVFDHAHEEKSEIGQWPELLGTLGLATSRLAGLLKIQKALEAGEGGDIASALSEALRGITAELSNGT